MRRVRACHTLLQSFWPRKRATYKRATNSKQQQQHSTTEYSAVQHPGQSQKQQQKQEQDTACVQDEIITGNEFFSPSGYDKKMR